MGLARDGLGYMNNCALTKQIHSDKFPQRSFVASATSLTLLQFSGDLRR